MRADILALVQLLSNNMSDPITIDKFYDDTMYEFAREGWFVDANIVPLTRGQLEVDLRAVVGPSLVNRLGIIYDDAELEDVRLRQMEAIDPQWRDALGYPRSYVTQDENADVIALHPAPRVNSNPNLGVFGEPLGLDYPTYNLAIFYSFAPLTDFPLAPWYYLELAIALRIIALEYKRESDHFDPEYSQAAQTLCDLCKQLLA